MTSIVNFANFSGYYELNLFRFPRIETQTKHPKSVFPRDPPLNIYISDFPGEVKLNIEAKLKMECQELSKV